MSHRSNSSSFTHLLAKSTATPNAPRPHERLDGHILDVLAAARTLLHATGHQLLGSLALPSRWLDVIEPAVARGALLNDLGNIFLSDARGINAPSIEWNLTVLVTTDRQASLDAGHANSIPGNAGPARNIFLDIGLTCSPQRGRCSTPSATNCLAHLLCHPGGLT